jgi:low temperature requirement protein LtrA
MHVRSVEGEERVTPLELFFDLVFVFALTQVTGFLAANATPEGLVRGALLFAALWWAWEAYAWLTNTLDPEEGAVRLAVFATTGAMLIVALATPSAFGAEALVFGVAYFVVRVLHIVLYVIAGRDDPDLRAAVLRFAPGAVIGPSLLVIAAFFDGRVELALWGAALVVDYGSALVGRGRGWRLSPAHFVERHGLIIIIALGESIVAIGAGAELGLSFGQAGAAVLGVAVAAALWWIYFDVVALVSARRLARAPEGRERNELARDSYSYLHLPMVAGIVLGALGLKKTLGNVEDPLEVVPAFALLGGVAIYLLGHVGFRFRNVRTINRQRLLLSLALFALLPVAIELPALATLAIVAALLWALITYETISYGEARQQVRHGEFAPEAQ